MSVTLIFGKNYKKFRPYIYIYERFRQKVTFQINRILLPIKNVKMRLTSRNCALNILIPVSMHSKRSHNLRLTHFTDVNCQTLGQNCG